MESIGQLTAGLAHDFNNLLQVVQGNLEMMRHKLGDERLLRYLDNAASAAERGAKLTRQLLAFARKTRLETRPTDLNDLVNEFGDMLESTAGSRIDLQFNLRRRLPTTMVDPVHLEMALLNVLINARDAMPDGGTVVISTATLKLDGREADRVADGLPAGEYVALSVADEGSGMPDHVLERATEPFFTTKETGKGTGLGLAMVHGFVQQSLGRLEIESRVGRGTTVRMLFPAASERPVRVPQRAPDRAGDPAPVGNAETILVVEDSDDVLVLARENLETLGYRVVTARSGNEALEVLDRLLADGGAVDLLFTDLVMPGTVNGLVLADRFKERLPGVPVLLTTGYNEDLVAHGPRAPNMDVLGKPYRRAELADRVRAALNRRNADGERAPPRLRPPGPEHEG
jgi:CheY-like chemotaxis protein